MPSGVEAEPGQPKGKLAVPFSRQDEPLGFEDLSSPWVPAVRVSTWTLGA